MRSTRNSQRATNNLQILVASCLPKMIKKPRTKHIRRRRVNFNDFGASATLMTHEKNQNDDESHESSCNSTESFVEFVIPGDIPDLDSLMVYNDESFSKFFKNTCNTKNKSYNSTENLTNFVIPGDIPDIHSLMVHDTDLLSNFFMNLPDC